MDTAIVITVITLGLCLFFLLKLPETRTYDITVPSRVSDPEAPTRFTGVRRAVREAPVRPRALQGGMPVRPPIPPLASEARTGHMGTQGPQRQGDTDTGPLCLLEAEDRARGHSRPQPPAQEGPRSVSPLATQPDTPPTGPHTAAPPGAFETTDS